MSLNDSDEDVMKQDEATIEEVEVEVEETPEEPEAPVAHVEQELKEGLLRARAEFDNYRKRSQRDLADARANAQMQTIMEFATVMDNFQLAMMAVDSSDDISALKAGMKMIHNEFERAFERMGVEMLDPEGAEFDPTHHEALQTETSDEHDEGTVLRVVKRGYQLGERLIRPACVIVSSGPEAAADEGNA